MAAAFGRRPRPLPFSSLPLTPLILFARWFRRPSAVRCRPPVIPRRRSPSSPRAGRTPVSIAPSSFPFSLLVPLPCRSGPRRRRSPCTAVCRRSPPLSAVGRSLPCVADASRRAAARHGHPAASRLRHPIYRAVDRGRPLGCPRGCHVAAVSVPRKRHVVRRPFPGPWTWSTADRNPCHCHVGPACRRRPLSPRDFNYCAINQLRIFLFIVKTQ
uniref:Uncharacterized protein n=1 Tax=Oryza sativa subsp. japonica TaxID=39947 RepID=Q6YX51_ORYSJ|nr:hypothetical protein [Oryza sativa Japonica Group]